MDTNDAYRLGTALMAQHNLPAEGWKLRYDNATVRFGACHYGPREITLSRALVSRNGERAVRLVILHEIAHALTPGRGHGPEWIAKCLEIGGDGKARYSHAEVTGVDHRWYADCGSCGKRYTRARRPADGRYMCKCQGQHSTLTWRDREAVSRTVYGPTTMVAFTNAPAPAPAPSPEASAASNIKWRGIVRETKTMVAIIDRKGQAGLRWAMACETHGEQVERKTSSEVWAESAHPLTWCNGCRKGA